MRIKERKIKTLYRYFLCLLNKDTKLITDISYVGTLMVDLALYL